MIPGTRQLGWDYPVVAWPTNGQWVFFANGRDLVAYQPGTVTAYRVDIELPWHIWMAAQ